MLHKGVERPAVHKLRDDEAVWRVKTAIQKLDNVFMPQARDRQQLTMEDAEEAFAELVLIVQNLNGDSAARAIVDRFEYLAETTGANLTDDAIVFKLQRR